ncbi:MAG: hypothetical protein AAB362_02965 [Patescibacteria group bacterium]
MHNHGSPKEPISFELDVHTGQVIVKISFNIFLNHTNPKQGLILFPEQMDFLKEKIEDAILKNNGEKIPSS